MGIEIVATCENDWEAVRDLRLRALADAPDAFGATLDDARARPERYWRSWARGNERLQAWLARDGHRPRGLLSSGISSEGTGMLGALWVDPAARGQRLGERLLLRGCEWLTKQGCTRLELHVTEGNPARAIYTKLGFELAGARTPLREGSELFELTMARPALAPGEFTAGSA